MMKVLLRIFAKVFSVEMKSEVLPRQSLVERLIQHREGRGQRKGNSRVSVSWIWKTGQPQSEHGKWRADGNPSLRAELRPSGASPLHVSEPECAKTRPGKHKWSSCNLSFFSSSSFQGPSSAVSASGSCHPSLSDSCPARALGQSQTARPGQHRARTLLWLLPRYPTCYCLEVITGDEHFKMSFARNRNQMNCVAAMLAPSEYHVCSGRNWRTRTSSTEGQRALGQKRLEPHREPVLCSGVLLQGKCSTGMKHALSRSPGAQRHQGKACAWDREAEDGWQGLPGGWQGCCRTWVSCPATF